MKNRLSKLKPLYVIEAGVILTVVIFSVFFLMSRKNFVDESLAEVRRINTLISSIQSRVESPEEAVDYQKDLDLFPLVIDQRMMNEYIEVLELKNNLNASKKSYSINADKNYHTLLATYNIENSDMYKISDMLEDIEDSKKLIIPNSVDYNYSKSLDKNGKEISETQLLIEYRFYFYKG